MGIADSNSSDVGEGTGLDVEEEPDQKNLVDYGWPSLLDDNDNYYKEEDDMLQNKELNSVFENADPRNVHFEQPVRTVELRLAGVFYGGVSLVVYEYGQVMEISNLLRAGHAFEKWCNLEIKKYQKICQSLSSTAKVYLEMLQQIYKRYNIEIRPVLDIVSGTSAGGILACVLAKAQVRNNTAGSLQKLREIVLEKFDVAYLTDTDLLKDMIKEKRKQESTFNPIKFVKRGSKEVFYNLLIKLASKKYTKLQDSCPAWFVGHVLTAIRHNFAVFSGENLEAIVKEAFQILDQYGSDGHTCYNTSLGVTVFTPVTDIDSYGKVSTLGETNSLLFTRFSESVNSYTMTFKTSRDDFHGEEKKQKEEEDAQKQELSRSDQENCQKVSKTYPLLLAVRATSAFPFLFPGIRLTNEFNVEAGGNYLIRNQPYLNAREHFRAGCRLNKFSSDAFLLFPECINIRWLMDQKDECKKKIANLKIELMSGENCRNETNENSLFYQLLRRLKRNRKEKKNDNIQDHQALYMEERELLDGGIVNNKPFRPVIGKLNQRRQGYGHCIDRRIIFLEPHPEPGTVPQISQKKEEAMENKTELLLPKFADFENWCNESEQECFPLAKEYIRNLIEKQKKRKQGKLKLLQKRRNAAVHMKYMKDMKTNMEEKNGRSTNKKERSNMMQDFEYFKGTIKSLFGIYSSQTTSDEFLKVRDINKNRMLKLEQRIHYIHDTSELSGKIKRKLGNKYQEMDDDDYRKLVYLYKINGPDNENDFNDKMAEILVDNASYRNVFGSIFHQDSENGATENKYRSIATTRYLHARENDFVTSFTELLNGRNWLYVDKSTSAHIKLHELIEKFAKEKTIYKDIDDDGVTQKDIATRDFWFIMDMFTYGTRHLTNTSLWTTQLQLDILENKKLEKAQGIKHMRKISHKAGMMNHQLHAHITALWPIKGPSNGDINRDERLESLRKQMNLLFWTLVDCDTLLSEIENEKNLISATLLKTENKVAEELHKLYKLLGKKVEEGKKRIEEKFIMRLNELNEAFLKAAKSIFCQFVKWLCPNGPDESETNSKGSVKSTESLFIDTKSYAWKCFKKAIHNGWLMDLHSFQTLSDPLGEFGTITLKRLSPSNSCGLFRDKRQEFSHEFISASEIFLKSTENLHARGFINRGYRQNDMLWGHIDGVDGMCTLLTEVVTKQLCLEFTTTTQFGGKADWRPLPYARGSFLSVDELNDFVKKTQAERYAYIYSELETETYIKKALSGLLKATDNYSENSVRESIYSNLDNQEYYEKSKKLEEEKKKEIKDGKMSNEFFKVLGIFLNRNSTQDGARN